MLASLTVLGDTSLELTSTSSDDEDSAISLGGTGNHVLDEITMTRSVNNLCETDRVLIIDIGMRDDWRWLLTVTMNLGVSNFQRAISIVIPRSRSALSLSSTQATERE